MKYLLDTHIIGLISHDDKVIAYGYGTVKV